MPRAWGVNRLFIKTTPIIGINNKTLSKIYLTLILLVFLIVYRLFLIFQFILYVRSVRLVWNIYLIFYESTHTKLSATDNSIVLQIKSDRYTSSIIWHFVNFLSILRKFSEHLGHCYEWSQGQETQVQGQLLLCTVHADFKPGKIQHQCTKEWIDGSAC